MEAQPIKEVILSKTNPPDKFRFSDKTRKESLVYRR